MKRSQMIFGLLLFLGSMSGGIAWADHGHGHVGVSIGIPLGWPWYYPPYYPAYYPPVYPPVVAVPASPPVYVEQGAAPPSAGPQASAQDYWHYCTDPQGYYPYVKQCPGGWMTVVPQQRPPQQQPPHP